MNCDLATQLRIKQEQRMMINHNTETKLSDRLTPIKNDSQYTICDEFTTYGIYDANSNKFSLFMPHQMEMYNYLLHV